MKDNCFIVFTPQMYEHRMAIVLKQNAKESKECKTTYKKHDSKVAKLFFEFL